MNRLSAAIFLICVFVLTQTVCAESFQSELDKFGMVLAMPDVFESAALQTNPDLKYDYALHHKKAKYEVRYLLRRAPRGSESAFKSEFDAIKDKIAGGVQADSVKQIPADEALKQFGASAASMANIKNNTSDFGKGYKNCLMVGVYKKDFGQYYMIHLFDAWADVNELMYMTLNSLRFQQAKDRAVNAKWTDQIGMEIAEKYLVSKGYRWTDFKPEILTKEKYPKVFYRYYDTIKNFQYSNYFWVGLTSDVPEKPVIHIFINKDSNEVIGHITND